MSIWYIFAMLSIIKIHFKTGNVVAVAATWGLVSSLLLLLDEVGIWALAVGGVSAFGVAWLLFSLANYLEESIFLRLFVLLVGMMAMLIVPSVVADIVLALLS